jgi:hypothetical protein
MTRRPRSLGGECVLGGVAALAFVLIASGCWFPRARSERLRDTARALVPPAASVVAEEEGDCVELARSPSCVHLYFVTERSPLLQRVRAVEERAGDAGWELERKEFLAGGASLRFRSRGASAVVYLWAEERAAPCREAPRKDCADSILVERRS